MQLMNYEYKVITQSNGVFSGKFSPAKLEEVLNQYAAAGWMVKGMATAETRPGLGKVRQELVLVLQRSA